LYGEYVQKLDKVTGVRLLTETAKELFPINSSFNVHVGREFFLVNDSPLFLLKSGSDNGVSPTSLAMVYLNSTGDLILPGQSIPLATFSANKKRIQFNKPVGQATIAFIEDKGSGEKIYAQRFTNAILGTNIPNNNSLLLYTNPITNILDIKSPINMNTIAIFDSTGKTLFTQNNIKSDSFFVDTENWSQGVYFVKITCENAQENNLKVIKK